MASRLRVKLQGSEEKKDEAPERDNVTVIVRAPNRRARPLGPFSSSLSVPPSMLMLSQLQ